MHRAKPDILTEIETMSTQLLWQKLLHHGFFFSSSQRVKMQEGKDTAEATQVRAGMATYVATRELLTKKRTEKDGKADKGGSKFSRGTTQVGGDLVCCQLLGAIAMTI